MFARRKWVVGLVAVGVVVFVVLLVVFRREREPEYGGKRLSEWVVLYNDTASSQSVQSQEAANAIRGIGTNALPYLLKWMRYETPTWKRRLDETLVKLKPEWIVEVGSETRADSVASAFGLLGSAADVVIPELTAMLNDPKGLTCATRAACALADLGKPGLPPLLATVTNRQSDAQIRLIVVENLQMMGTNAQRAVPALQQLMREGDVQISNAASNALGFINPQALPAGWGL